MMKKKMMLMAFAMLIAGASSVMFGVGMALVGYQCPNGMVNIGGECYCRPGQGIKTGTVNPSSSLCNNCAPGYYNNAFSTTCAFCPPGTVPMNSSGMKVRQGAVLCDKGGNKMTEGGVGY